MIIVCPNCFASYEYKSIEIGISGLDVKCSICKQEWVQYDFKSSEVLSTKISGLKELAHKEYMFSLSKNNNIPTTQNKSESDQSVKSRLESMAARLDDSKKQNNDNSYSIKSTQPENDPSIILGFLLASVFCTLFLVLYVSNYKLQNSFPSWENVLSDYKILIDGLILKFKGIITSIKNFLN